MSGSKKRTRSETGAAASSAAPGSPADQWKKVDTCLVLSAIPDAPATKAFLRVESFDLDDTLITPSSGAVFAKSATDWTWLNPIVPETLLALAKGGAHVVIFTNQSGIAGKGFDAAKAKEIETKIIAVCQGLTIPVTCLIATADDNYRKPSLGMWSLLERMAREKGWEGLDLSKSRYCGDAAGRKITTMAGRKKDFSCSDRKFAYNLGLSFITPEELFLQKPPSAFEWDGISPEVLKALPTQHTTPPALLDGAQSVVVLVGPPGIGKSTFSSRALSSFVAVSRDNLKTPQKCLQVATDALKQGRSVVVDNTSATRADRAPYIALAKKFNATCRCALFSGGRHLAWHMNVTRSRVGLGARVSSVAYNVFFSKYEEPTTAEGFADVIAVPPTAVFDGLPPVVKEAFFLLS